MFPNGKGVQRIMGEEDFSLSPSLSLEPRVTPVLLLHPTTAANFPMDSGFRTTFTTILVKVGDSCLSGTQTTGRGEGNACPSSLCT